MSILVSKTKEQIKDCIVSAAKKAIAENLLPESELADFTIETSFVVIDFPIASVITQRNLPPVIVSAFSSVMATVSVLVFAPMYGALPAFIILASGSGIAFQILLPFNSTNISH